MERSGPSNPAARVTDGQAPLVRRLDAAAVLEVAGDDAATWLQGQVTNDVSDVGGPPRKGVYAAVVDVKGKIVADAWVLPRAPGDGFLLVTDAAARDALFERLDAFVVMEDVELTWRDDLRVLCVAGGAAAAVASTAGGAPEATWLTDRLGLGAGIDLVVDRAEADALYAGLVAAAAAEGGGAADATTWDAVRVHAGVPAFGVDFGPGRFPQEVGLRDRAVSFRKGCYLGQEAVHMLEMRGRVKRRLVRLKARSTESLDPPGTALRAADGTEAGVLGTTTADGGWGLAVLGNAHAEVGTVLRGSDGTYEVGDDTEPDQEHANH